MRRYRHSLIVDEISKKTGLDRKVVHLIIRKFYDGLRKLIFRNEEINIKGFFTLKLSPHYKCRVEKEGKGINLRKRKDQKYTYVKKGYKR
jgi:nucleoid DNA-binding protein